jgi:hypothetical protein
MRIAVSEAIHVTTLALDAGSLCACCGAHSLASAAYTNVGVFSLRNKPLVFVECFRINSRTDEFAREITVADWTQAVQVSLIDFCNDICANALHTHFDGRATGETSLEGWRVVITANHTAEAWWLNETKACTDALHVLEHETGLLVLMRGRGGGWRHEVSSRRAANTTHFS